MKKKRMVPTTRRRRLKKLIKRFGCRCLRCGLRFTFQELTVDHVKPLSKGGTNALENLQPLCFDCNTSKGSEETDYRGSRRP